MQHVADPAPIALPTIDLEPEDPAERERVAAQIVRGETHRPFNLAQGPLVRPLLIRFDPERHDLVVTLHHIVCDGSSLGILTRELSALYEAFARGDASPLPELPLQYADYAAWQREWLTGPTLETQRRYWLEHLTGLAAPLRLAGDHPRSTTLARESASHDLVLSGELADGLRELSRRQGATLFMVLLAGFKALLSRYTGQEDVAIGTPLAHRNHLELEPLIGLFANTLVLRTDLGGDPTFRELLARVRETVPGRLCAPRHAFREAGGGPASRTRPRPEPAVRDQLRVSGRRRVDDGELGDGGLALRADAVRSRPPRRNARGDAAVLARPLRAGDRRTADGVLSNAAARRTGRSRSPTVDASRSPTMPRPTGC